MKRPVQSAPNPGQPSLANQFLRQIASVEGQITAFVTLPKLMPKSYTRESLRGIGKFRDRLIEARKMVLDPAFFALVEKINSEQVLGELRTGLWRFCQLTFDPLWLEWDNEEDGVKTGMLLSHSPHDPQAIQSRVIYQTNDGASCVAPPMGMITRLHTEDPFGRDIEWAGHQRINYLDRLETLSGRHIPADLKGWMAERVLPMTAHSGGEVFKAAGSLEGQDERFNIQAGHAWAIALSVIFVMPTALGLLNLAPVRHIVSRNQQRAPADSAAPAWHWKHEHDLVTLTRPLTVTEVQKHVSAGIRQRKEAALHTVMGFWRVRGGSPQHNHTWSVEVVKSQGTDTELGRPHRDGVQRFRCPSCRAVRSWVASHNRGNPLMGIVTHDYAVETEKSRKETRNERPSRG